ncbi:MAG: LamG-like jellyroll fold domain-containing protein [Chitinophagales bacterium]
MKNTTYIIILLVLFSNLGWAQVLQFNFEEETGVSTTIDSVSLVEFAIANHFNRPERIEGVKGNALRLDGWTTWIEKPNYQIPGITNKMTIELWYATEAFAAANGGLISKIGGGTGFSLEVDKFGKIIWAFHANGQFYVLISDQKIEKYKWNHIVATADLESKVAKIYVNGEEWATKNLGAHTVLTPATEPLYIGRQTNRIQFDQFVISASNGAIDELLIYNEILSSEDLINHYQLYANMVSELTIDPNIRHIGDHLRPKYHSMPNTAWANEPYGLTYFEDKYHLFFQKNPNGPYLNFMHWGHLSSPDLVNWTEEKITLAPDEMPGFDNFGTWSGTTIKDENGVPVIAYTGVDGAKAGIGMAFSQDNDLVNWEKYGQNPVIAKAPTILSNTDFRDPYIWKEGNVYYMIIGSGVPNNGGGILFLYRSENLTDWVELPFFYRDIISSRSGVFWEMPFFLPLNDNDYILGVTPTPQANQRAQVLYWIGKFENERFIPYNANPKKFELINENLLAPAIGMDKAERLTYIGIIPEDRSVADQVAAGWRQTFSIPRFIRLLEDGEIAHIPHPNLCRLRGEVTQILDKEINFNTFNNLPEIAGTQTELLFDIEASSDAKFSIEVYKNLDNLEKTAIEFDFSTNTISLNRLESSLSQTLEDKRTANYIFSPDNTLKVHIFLDHSTLEVFIDQLVVFSARVYPSRVESNKVDLKLTQGSVNIRQLDAWQLKSIGEELGMDVCEPMDLPNMLYTSIRDIHLSKLLFMITPNPSNGSISMDYLGTEILKNTKLQLLTTQGKLIRQEDYDLQPSSLQWYDLEKGLYLLKISAEEGSRTFKLLVN